MFVLKRLIITYNEWILYLKIDNLGRSELYHQDYQQLNEYYRQLFKPFNYTDIISKSQVEDGSSVIMLIPHHKKGPYNADSGRTVQRPQVM